MALPRSQYVRNGDEAVYHCFSRCVRRAFLYGFDPISRKDFSHRKTWLINRLRHLASIFAIDVCAFSIMHSHHHTILRTRPDIAASWSNHQVAQRWLKLFPKRNAVAAKLSLDDQILLLLRDPNLIAKLRLRLCSLSWFMGQLNEFIARAANKEDNVKGRFFESRFKCQVLLDVPAIASCMVYVDLNPVRAGIAPTPENSDFTSIQDRIRTWQKKNIPPMPKANSSSRLLLSQHDQDKIPKTSPVPNLPSHSTEPSSQDWLCPISSQGLQKGILPMSAMDYFDLVDRSGRLTRPHKPGSIDPDLTPILLRIAVHPDSWPMTVSRFGHKFHLAAGLLSNIRIFADQIGRKWLQGISEARLAFASSFPREISEI